MDLCGEEQQMTGKGRIECLDDTGIKNRRRWGRRRVDGTTSLRINFGLRHSVGLWYRMPAEYANDTVEIRK